jgi:hypothetical protein
MCKCMRNNQIARRVKNEILCFNLNDHKNKIILKKVDYDC